MRASRRPIFAGFFFPAIIFLATAIGCDSDTKSADAPSSKSVRRPSVASITPAGTDLLLAMGGRDHLIAVSNWDADNPLTKGLPRVGDYRNVEKEQLTALKPDILLVQYHPD